MIGTSGGGLIGNVVTCKRKVVVPPRGHPLRGERTTGADTWAYDAVEARRPSIAWSDCTGRCSLLDREFGPAMRISTPGTTSVWLVQKEGTPPHCVCVSCANARLCPAHGILSRATRFCFRPGRTLPCVPATDAKVSRSGRNGTPGCRPDVSPPFKRPPHSTPAAILMPG